MSSTTCNGPTRTVWRPPTTPPSFARTGRSSASWSRTLSRRSTTWCRSRLLDRPARWCSPRRVPRPAASGHSRDVALGPRPRGPRLFLEAVDLGLLLLGQPDVVEAVQHAVLAVRVDIELHHAAVGPADLLLLQVDRQRRVGAALGVVEQFLQILGADLDRQHAVLEAVVVEDVAELGRDHAADAVVHQRPGRVLARGAAAEVVVGDDDLRLAVGWLVEHEIRIVAAVVHVAHLGEQA